MEDDVLDILEQIGYSGPLLDKESLKRALEGGPKSIEYTKLVEWLSEELKYVCNLEESVNAVTSSDDSSSFLLEMSSFLKELGCPHKSLIEGTVSQRLMSIQSRSLLIGYLCSELQAARIIAVERPETNKNIDIKVQESTTANDLKTALIALGFSKPPPDVTVQKLFTKMETRIEEHLAQLPPKLVSKPLFTGLLSEKQWKALSQLHAAMTDEYRLRREMLLKRLDVTIQSFQWSSRAKNKADEVTAVYVPRRRQMSIEPSVDLADLLSAREDLTNLEKTSSSNVRKNTSCSINKILIGRVPDRGGRPCETRAPPPEMPSWQKRTEGPSGDRGGGRGGRVQGGWSGGRGRGGRVQGGWSGGRGGEGRGRGGFGGGGGGQHREDGGQKQQYSYDAAGSYSCRS